MRNKILIGAVLLVALMVSLTLPLLFSNSDTKIGDKSYALEVVDTPELRQRGLSGRESLEKNQGMLFVFEQSRRQCIWMKDMHFSIDILWLDSDKKVINLEKNVSPQTYPNTFCADNARYVIELPAGQIRESKISRGDVIDL